MSVKIDGKKYDVTENVGFSHDLNCYVKYVSTADGDRVAVKIGGKWKFHSVISSICLPPLMDG